MVEQTKTFDKVILVYLGCSFIAMLHILLSFSHTRANWQAESLTSYELG